MGTGLQRPLNCPGQCGGPAKDAKLLTPGSLATGPDGSIYIGDFNLVRRITPEGNVYTVLQLRWVQLLNMDINYITSYCISKVMRIKLFWELWQHRIM